MSVSMLGENFGQVPNWPVRNPHAFSQLGRNVLSHQPLENQACYFRDWRNDPRLLYVRPLIRKHIIAMLRKTNHNLQCLPADLVTALDNQLFMEASSKEEYVNLSTLHHRLQMVLQRRSINVNYVQQEDDILRASLPSFNTNPIPRLLPVSCNPDAGRPLSGSFKRNACSSNTGQFNFTKGHCNDIFKLGDTDKLMSDVRNGTLCSVGIRQSANEALLFPENTSSITMNSDGNWNAYDGAIRKVQFFQQGEVNPLNFKLHGESSQNSKFNVPLEMSEALILSSSSSLIPEQVSQEILEVSNSFPGTNFSGSYYSLEDSVPVQSKITDSQMYQQQFLQPSLQSQVPRKESHAFEDFASEGFTSLNSFMGLDKKGDSSCVSHFDKCLPDDDCYLSGSLNQLNPRKRAFGVLDGSNYLNSGYLEEIVHYDSKRLKKENFPCPSKQPNVAEHIALELQDHHQSVTSINSELSQEKKENSRQPLEEYSTSIREIRMNGVDNDLKQNHETATVSHEEIDLANNTSAEENGKITSDDMWSQWMQEYEKEPCLLGKDGDDVQIKPIEVELEAEYKEGTKTQNPKGSFYSEFFTADQIRVHLSSLGECMDQGALKGKRGDIENICHLCALDKIMLAPVSVYCSCCGVRVKRNVSYYCTLDEAAQHCFCTSCYRLSRGGNVSVNGMCISKEKLCKKKNDAETEEAWVQCDKCDRWQHQICALYNNQSDLDGKADFTCPKCWLKEVENGHYMPRSMTAVFSAKELPKTRLSNHIEKRIFKHLNQEREKRAKATGKHFDEVPGAEDLVVRVVLSVDRISKVKKVLLDVFDESYPSEFPYKSKAILLFQKIEGVDVCLFSMYVQEFGSECSQPNQRSVYVSYLDSVKHFTPDIQAGTGEPLRTFIYHEILIGYLDFVKQRGFTTCHIWSCPPTKGEDYILYCHPESQRTPKSDQLRKWYKSMLQKAAKEKIVVNWSNVYEQFFVPTGEGNLKITAARLPYFEGDYWSTVSEDFLRKLENESRVDSKKKTKVTKRALKAMGHANSSDYATTKDVLLMRKLEHNMLPFKDDFMVVILQFVCMHCHEVIVSGIRWFCDKCPSYQLCERCHDAQPNPYAKNKHTSTNKELHLLSKVMVDNVPSDTKDVDDNIETDLFDNRSTFLNFCQKNSYQFDTLRRAKHSTTMILHHLQKLCVSAMKKLCSICDKNVVVDKSWICQICPEFNVCSTCYQERSDSCHGHKLIPSSAVIHGNESEFTQQKKLLQGSGAHIPRRTAVAESAKGVY